MQPDHLEKIYRNFCAAFPELDFGFCSSQGTTVYVHSPGSIPEDVFPGVPGVMQTMDGRVFRRVVYRFSENCTVFALFCLDDLSCELFPVMADTLTKLVRTKTVGSMMQSDNSLVFNHLLHAETLDQQSCLALLSADFPYDFSLPRFFCVIQVLPPHETAIVSKQLMNHVLACIRDHPVIHSQDITGILDRDKIVLCKTIQPSEYPLKVCCTATLSGPLNSIQTQFSVKLHTGVGFIAKNIGEYSFCLRAAYQMVQEKGNNGLFCFAIDALPNLLLSKIVPRQLDHYFADYAQLLERHPDWITTMEALVQNNMDPAKAASAIYLHPNSIAYRIRSMLQEFRLESLRSDQTKLFLILLYQYMQMRSKLQ